MSAKYIDWNLVGSGFVVLALAGFPLSVWTADQPVAEVEIFKFQFLPQEVNVEVGDTLRWVNKEKRQYHSVWFEAAGDPEPGYIFPDETYERTFDQPGTFTYHCGPHPKMTGTVHVK